MWVMVAGPYRSGSRDPEVWASNLAVLNSAALALFRAGHVPVIGVDMALPLIAAGGGFEEVMMPLSLALSERCDACVRIGGMSAGADAEVARFEASGRPVFASVAAILEHRFERRDKSSLGPSLISGREDGRWRTT